MTERVYVNSNCQWSATEVYHTDPDCMHVGDNASEKPLSVLSGDLSECTVCTGEEYRTGVEQRTSLRDMIKAGEVDV